MDDSTENSLIVIGYLPGCRDFAKGLCVKREMSGTVFDYELLIRDIIKPLFEKEYPDYVEDVNYNLRLLNFTTVWFKNKKNEGGKNIFLIRQEIRFPHYMQGYLADEEDEDILSKNKALVLRTGVPEILSFISDEMWIQTSVSYVHRDVPVHYKNMRSKTDQDNDVFIFRENASNFDAIFCNGS
jgi:hypothetical protein